MPSSSGPCLPRSADDSTPPPGSDAPPTSYRPPSSVPPPSSGAGEGRPPSLHFTGPFHADRPDRCKTHKGWRSDVITLWDVDNAAPRNPNSNRSALPFHHILANIKEAPNRLVDTSGMEIKAYGNGNMSKEHMEAISTAPGLTFYLVPKIKQAADRKLIRDLQHWAIEHPPPAYVFLASGDGDFYDPLSLLVSRGYSLLLAYPDKCDRRLLQLATYALPFDNLIHDVTVNASALLP